MPPKRQHQRRKGDDRDRETPRYGCRSGKTGWDHRHGAESALKDAARTGIRSKGAPTNAIRTAYRCDQCRRWHLTSLQVEQSQAVERGKRESRVAIGKRDEAAAACTTREWAVRREAIRVLYGKSQGFRPEPPGMVTEAERHYALALELATVPDLAAFWREIGYGDEAARISRAVAEGCRKIVSENA